MAVSAKLQVETGYCCVALGLMLTILSAVTYSSAGVNAWIVVATSCIVEQRHNILLMALVVFIVLLSTSDFDAQKKEQDSKVDQQRVSWLLCATSEYTSTMLMLTVTNRAFVYSKTVNLLKLLSRKHQGILRSHPFIITNNVVIGDWTVSVTCGLSSPPARASFGLASTSDSLENF